MLEYDENGNLRDFEENEGIVICNHCKKPYRQRTEEQVPGFREADSDICPYCHKSNGRSYDVEFFNKPLSDDEIKKLQM